MKKENLKFKAVLVDFDGTLFDTWTNPYAKGEKKFDWKEVENNIPNCALYEGWKGVFAWLKSKQIPIGIVSHCTKGYITKTLKFWKLNDVFSCLLTRYGNGTRYSGKVSKDKLISLALQEDAFKGIEAGEVLYLSDQVKDMSITRLAGAIPVGCLWGSKEKQELEKEGCITLDTPLELIQLIKNQLNI